MATVITETRGKHADVYSKLGYKVIYYILGTEYDTAHMYIPNINQNQLITSEHTTTYTIDRVYVCVTINKTVRGGL